MAPWVLSSSNVSLEGTEIRVKSPYPFFIACYVQGRPKPKITWLKDSENIDKFIENNDEVSLSDDNQILEFKFATKKYEGKYECSVENRVGHIQPFANVIIEDEALTPSDTNLGITIVSFTIIVIILFSFVLILVIRHKKNKNKSNHMLQLQLFLFQEGNVGKLNKECTIEEQAELLPYDHSFEVERENITLGKQLGAGAFGRVLLSQVKGLNGKESPTRVALKMCKFGHDKAHLRALIMELKIMIHLGKHLNIVNLLGAHTSNIDKGELWILVEYCKFGNLLKFIQRGKSQFINQIDPVTSELDLGRRSPFKNDPLSPMSLGCNIEYERYSNHDAHPDLHPESSIEIAPPSGGRHYELPPTNPTPRKESSISDSDYDFTYSLFINSDMTGYSQTPFSPSSPSTSGSSCDLAARNLLLASNNVVKICDFGLSREMYKNYCI
ncbi:Vascular endothelial growth factor receptor 3 [Armadillidium nasatum]|uniref:Vascular endothelial growth factor receptor 3 n=1 Tax=Armadillidium nasatum TaxID=96803 RepID=A0A5N5SJD2_9CRUS|nr:Vascular endothelial growth factor receptor 3 [Armadillidium nasatum]